MESDSRMTIGASPNPPSTSPLPRSGTMPARLTIGQHLLQMGNSSLSPPAVFSLPPPLQNTLPAPGPTFLPADLKQQVQAGIGQAHPGCRLIDLSTEERARLGATLWLNKSLPGDTLQWHLALLLNIHLAELKSAIIDRKPLPAGLQQEVYKRIIRAYPALPFNMVPVGDRARLGAMWWREKSIPAFVTQLELARSLAVKPTTLSTAISHIRELPSGLASWVNTRVEQEHPGETLQQILPGDRARMGAEWWFHHLVPGNPTKLELARALEISSASLSNAVNSIVPQSKDLRSWVTYRLALSHPGCRREEITAISRAAVGARWWFNDELPYHTTQRQLAWALDIPFQLLSQTTITLLPLPEGLQQQVDEALQQDSPAHSPDSLSNRQKAEMAARWLQQKRLPSQPTYQELARALLVPASLLASCMEALSMPHEDLPSFLNKKLAEKYPGKTRERITIHQRAHLAAVLLLDSRSAYRLQRPELAKFLGISLPTLNSAVTRYQKIKEWMSSQPELNSPIRMLESLATEERIQLGVYWWPQLQHRFHGKIVIQLQQLADGLNVDISALNGAIKSFDSRPGSAAHWINSQLTSAEADAPQGFSAAEKAQLGVELALSLEKPPETTLALIAEQLNLNLNVLVKLMSRQRQLSSKLPDNRRSNSPMPVDEPPASIKQEAEEMPPPHLSIAPLLALNDEGQILSTAPSATLPLPQHFSLNNALILSDCHDPTKSVTLESEKCPPDQLKISSWGTLNALFNRMPDPQVKSIKQTLLHEARRQVAIEGPQLAEELQRGQRMMIKPSIAQNERDDLVQLGYGVFNLSGKTIPPFTLLGPYAGKLHPSEQSLRKPHKKLGTQLVSKYLWGTRSRYRTVDASTSGNLFRYFNSGKIPAAPAVARNNVAAIRVGKNLTFYVTNCEIAPGEEYFIDYGDKYNPGYAIDSARKSEIKSEPQAQITENIVTFPATARFIDNIGRADGWIDTTFELMPWLMTLTPMFRQQLARLVIVNAQGEAIVVWDACTGDTLPLSQWQTLESSASMAVIQHIALPGAASANHYNALIPLGRREPIQLRAAAASQPARYRVDRFSYRLVTIPPSGFCLTQAAQVALSHDIFATGAQLRQQVIELVNGGNYESQLAAAVAQAELAD